MNNLNDQYFKTREIHKKNFKKWGWIIWIGLFMVFLVYVFLNIQDQLKSNGIAHISNKDNEPVWVYDCMEDTIKQIRFLKTETVSSEKLIDILNKEYKDKIKLDLVRLSNDTIYVKIDNSEYLTQQMGTSGADEFMIEATFTLTELPNIKFVNYDFEFGDHASPGTYSRKYYLNWISKNKELNKK